MMMMFGPVAAAVVCVCVMMQSTVSSGLTYSRSDVSSEMNSRYELLQLNIEDLSLSSLSDSFTGLDYLVGGVRRALMGVLSVDGSRVVFKGVEQKDDGLVAQFTVLPASDAELDQFSAGWVDAITKKDPSLSNIFKTINFDYPPTILTGVTTTTTSTTSTTPGHNNNDDEDSSSNAGIVVGAVFGSLLAVSAVGGGGYYYKKKLDEKNNAARPKGVGERSPGAEGFTPGGLANVNIHGEATPNPNNY